MKKMYIQPKNEISKVELTSIVCYSGGFVDTDEEFGGDAPRRRTPVF